ncbi:MAG: type I-U CRISPR-associated protein Csb2 [Myxococcota bacterium]
MLAIEVTFLTGRYVATSYNDRRRAEWPPHPARMFSALVATHFADEAPDAAEGDALRWLEALEAPQIADAGATEREVVTVFVPVNDGGVLKSFEDAAAALDVARATKAKGVDKLEKKLRDAIKADLAEPATISKEGPKEAAALLPENRTRQPRTFPSVTPNEPSVTYIWSTAEPTPAQRQAIDALLARLVRVGHSSSLVSARLVDAPPAPTRVPADLGERYRVTRRGQLAALEDAFTRHRETEPRVMPAAFQMYAPAASPRRQQPGVAVSIFGDDWLVLRRVEGPHLPASAGPAVARGLRKVVLSLFGERPIPETISGHDARGAPTTQDHLAIVPLPFVGHARADGALLGVALVLPRGVDDADRRELYRALARWEGAARREPWNADLAEGEVPLVPLHLGPAGVWRLERVEGTARLVNLQAATWCQAATTWSSVAPVALDRNPGDLRARDPGKLAKAVAEANATVAAACRRIGLPEPSAVEILPAAPWAGAEKAKHYLAVPASAKTPPRVLTHVRVTFAEPVEGPVLIGAGRYLGLGLLRPEGGRHA